jgi:hypothetical protein
MRDGTRHFGSVPMVLLWGAMRDHLQTLNGVVITGFVTDGVTEGWIDFRYKDFNFSVNDQFGEYWFFVDNPACPDAILLDVLAHCAVNPKPSSSG